MLTKKEYETLAADHEAHGYTKIAESCKAKIRRLKLTEIQLILDLPSTATWDQCIDEIVRLKMLGRGVVINLEDQSI